jgi:glycosyltransferase involved in cell wall biosynthesis
MHITDVNNFSILLPCFNESESIENTIKKIEQVCHNVHNIKFNYIIIDDGSTDDTLSKLLLIQQQLAPEKIRIYELSRNFGKEAALTAGLDYVNCDACIILDADLQDPPEVITQMINGWRSGFDIVALRRSDRTTDNIFKRISAQFFYKIFNWLCDTKIPENVGDARLMDRQVIEALKLMPESERFMKGLFAWVGFKMLIIDVKREARKHGLSKFNPLKLLLLAVSGITSFSTSLLRVWICIGIIVSLYAFFHGLYIIARVFIFGVELPGYASLAVILLFVSGIQIMGIGIIGEYIGRNYIESKRRPTYIIRKIYE